MFLVYAYRYGMTLLRKAARNVFPLYKDKVNAIWVKWKILFLKNLTTGDVSTYSSILVPL